MFNLPNNTPYFLAFESDNGYIVMTQRWMSKEGEEMGPVSTFETYTDKVSVVSALETFTDERKG